MSPKLKAWLLTAAALGGTLAVAITQVGTDQGLTQQQICRRWEKQTRHADRIEWFAVVANGYTPPESAGGFPIGVRNGARFDIAPDGCPDATRIRVQARRSTNQGGWRMVAFRGPRLVARGWRQLAVDDSANVKCVGNRKGLKACMLGVSGIGAARARTLLQESNGNAFIVGTESCSYFVREQTGVDGEGNPIIERVQKSKTINRICRNGLLYACNEGGQTPCTVNLINAAHDVWPESVTLGEDPEQLVTADFPADEELEE